MEKDWTPILDLMSSNLVDLLKDKLNLTLEDALVFYYNSDVYKLIVNVETQYRLYGNLYILEDLVNEYNTKHNLKNGGK